MKTPISIVAGVVLFGIAGISPAFAWHLVPESTDFTGSGNTSATKNAVTLKCTASFTGDTDSSGVGYITGGSFTGEVGCTSVSLKNLPWKSEAVNKSTVDIMDVTFDSPIGDCGPSTLATKLKSGTVTFKNAEISGGCKVSGTVKTSPTLSIVSNDE